MASSCSFFKDFIYLFLERGEGRKKVRERSINVRKKHPLVASCMWNQTSDLFHFAGRCPTDWATLVSVLFILTSFLLLTLLHTSPSPLRTLCPVLPASLPHHWASPHCCVCSWVIHMCSLASFSWGQDLLRITECSGKFRNGLFPLSSARILRIFLAKEHICTTHRHRQQYADDQRERGGGWVEVGRQGEDGDICNSVNNKNKEENDRRKYIYWENLVGLQKIKLTEV